jgi:hypothetical protein
MDFSTGSGESTPFKDLSNTINTGNNNDSSSLSASANAQQPTTSSISVSEADKVDSNGEIDEIKQYRDVRWLTPPEALWRIYGFHLSKNSPPVMQLQLHMPNMHMVLFNQGQDIQGVINCEGVEKSMLTEYFEANRLHKEACGILYRDFPEWYTWQKGKNKYWKRRSQKTDSTPSWIHVGRIVSAHPAEGERYYL